MSQKERERIPVMKAIGKGELKLVKAAELLGHPFDDDELKTEKYLKSLSPAEELGVFVQIRAACLEENWRLKEAAQAYRIALRSFPKSKYVGLYLNNLKGEY